MLKKRIESIYSSVDIGFNSLIAFMTFLYIKQYYGIDLVGFFGLVLSVCSFAETIQMGLYDKPSYLGIGIGYKDFRLKVHHLILLISFPLLAINQLVISGYMVASIFYTLSYVLIQNIRIYDYIHNNVSKVSKRSFYIFIITSFLYLYLIFTNTEISLSLLLVSIALIRFIFILFNRAKIFAIENNKDSNQELGLLISSILTLIRSRLPLWALLPFGLGLVGIYETFRTLLEIYLIPSRPIFLVMLKNLKRDGPKKIFQFGILFSIATIFLILISLNYITNLDVFAIPELTTIHSFLAFIFISLFFWISEITGMIFEFNSYIFFESIRRGLSIITFVALSLIFFNILNFNLFLYLIIFMYFTEVVISLVNKDKLKLGK
tara:strand:- start:1919 stop:3052 length:1134 start_codon:yes stop_codon:yes gene_type:complete